MVVLIFVAFLLISFGVDAIIQYQRRKTASVLDTASAFPVVFDENTAIVPKGLYFDKTHTWAYMTKNGSVKIGINDFLQHTTGPITRIEMKNSGEKVNKGEPFLTIIQKGKRLNIYSPVSGTIKTQNQQLITNSSIINSSPYSDGWIYMIEPSNWLKETQFMKMAEQTNEWLKNEFNRLKDFFAIYIHASTPEYAHVTLQDGGALIDNVLSDLGPEVWEDFQTNFIDTVK